MTHNRMFGSPIRYARTVREAFADEQQENAAGIEGPPVVHVPGWRWIARDLWAWLCHFLDNKEKS